MSNTVSAITALSIEREMAFSERRMERFRQLEELDSQTRRMGRPTRFGFLQGFRRLTAAVPRDGWLQTTRRHADDVREPVALCAERAGT
jgi:hypothetical protein